LLRCLEKEPSARPQNANELKALLLSANVPSWTEAEARECWQRLAARRTQAPDSTPSDSQRFSPLVMTVDLRQRALSDTEASPP